jgi:transcriptional regulator with XRE-family HTH domain
MNWTVRDLANCTKVHRNTISAFEMGKTEPNSATLQVLQRALEDAGIVFTNGGEPGVKRRRLRRGDRVRFARTSTMIVSFPDLAESIGEVAACIDDGTFGPYAVHVDIKFPERADLVAGIPTHALVLAAAFPPQENGAGPGVRLKK